HGGREKGAEHPPAPRPRWLSSSSSLRAAPCICLLPRKRASGTTAEQSRAGRAECTNALTRQSQCVAAACCRTACPLSPPLPSAGRCAWRPWQLCGGQSRAMQRRAKARSESGDKCEDRRVLPDATHATNLAPPLPLATAAAAAAAAASPQTDAE